MARLINQEHLFIHTAKTGGTFFREALNYFGVPNQEVGEKHHSVIEAASASGSEKGIVAFKSTFGFIRNPVSWYRSRWAYAKMTHFPHKLAAFPTDHPVHKHWMATVWHDDLNVFVENTLRHFPDGVATQYFDRMLELRSWRTSGISIYRYENLVYDTASIISRLSYKTVSINEVQSLKPQLQSAGIGGKISPMLTKEIEIVEAPIMEMFY